MNVGQADESTLAAAAGYLAAEARIVLGERKYQARAVRRLCDGKGFTVEFLAGMEQEIQAQCRAANVPEIRVSHFFSVSKHAKGGCMTEAEFQLREYCNKHGDAIGVRMEQGHRGSGRWCNARFSEMPERQQEEQIARWLEQGETQPHRILTDEEKERRARGEDI